MHRSARDDSATSTEPPDPHRDSVADPTRRLGLIAGAGTLPVEAARRLRDEGFSIAAVGFEGLTDDALAAELPEAALKRVRLGQLGALASALEALTVERVLLLGKVPKSLVFEGSPLVEPDAEALGLLAGLAERGDEPLMAAIAAWLEGRGFELAAQQAVLESMLASRGPLARREPSAAERADFEVGRQAVSALGRFGIGQSVVVKQRCVLAVEAAEGTDATIRRAGELGGAGATVVKAARPGQDLRFDLPAVGPETLRVMRRAGASCLAVEAEACLLIDAEGIAAEAAESDIACFGFVASESS